MLKIEFCSNCGVRLEQREIDGVERKACPSCAFVHWGSYSIGVGALVVKEGKVLLVRRAQEPGKGNWTNPGGYIEQLEPIASTIEREVYEEAGIRCRAVGIAALRDQPRDIHNVYVAFRMEYLDGEPTPDGYEVDGAGFFGPEEMQEMKVAPFTRWLVDIALNGQGDGLQGDEEPIVPLGQVGLYKVRTL